MAVDEAILDLYGSAQAPAAPTLRLYGWHPPALSLGRGQHARGAHDPRYLRQHGIDLVRRPTGGLAVLHEYERTYAVVGRLRRDPFPGGVLDTYRRVSMALASALRALGVEVRTVGQDDGPGTTDSVACFERSSAHEITVGGRKLVGSAQLRRRGAFLQHGSILLDGDATRLARAVGNPTRAGRFTDLGTARSAPLKANDLDHSLARAFETCLGAVLEPGGLQLRELERATSLYAWKYCSKAWTIEARRGSRERRWGRSLSE